jgi:hypothetical protein
VRLEVGLNQWSIQQELHSPDGVDDMEVVEIEIIWSPGLKNNEVAVREGLRMRYSNQDMIAHILKGKFKPSVPEGYEGPVL